MNENKSGQAVQSKPADQSIKGNNGAMPNPKSTIMTPEKIKDPVVDKGNEQIGDVKKQQENKDSKESKVPVVEQKSSNAMSNPKQDINAPEKTKDPVVNKGDEQIGEKDKGQEKNERSEEKKSPVAEQKKEMPVSFDRN